MADGPFATGHYAPSAHQNLFVTEMVKKENQVSERLRNMITARKQQRPQTAATIRNRLPQSTQPTATASTFVTGKRPQSASASSSKSTPPQQHAAPPQTMDKPPAAPPVYHQPISPFYRLVAETAARQRERLLPKELDVLYNGEGGGRSRAAFLRLRRQLPVVQRYELPRSTSQNYGWELLNRSDEILSRHAHANALSSRPTTPIAEFRLDALQRTGERVVSLGQTTGHDEGDLKKKAPRPGEPGVYWGKKSIMTALMRKTGVFGKSEFISG